MLTRIAKSGIAVTLEPRIQRGPPSCLDQANPTQFRDCHHSEGFSTSEARKEKASFHIFSSSNLQSLDQEQHLTKLVLTAVSSGIVAKAEVLFLTKNAKSYNRKILIFLYSSLNYPQQDRYVGTADHQYPSDVRIARCRTWAPFNLP